MLYLSTIIEKTGERGKYRKRKATEIEKEKCRQCNTKENSKEKSRKGNATKTAIEKLSKRKQATRDKTDSESCKRTTLF